jgi:hypothetical protein
MAAIDNRPLIIRVGWRCDCSLSWFRTECADSCIAAPSLQSRTCPGPIANLPPIPVRLADGTERLIAAVEIGTVKKQAQSWDLAFKDLETSGYGVGQVWGRNGAAFLLLHQVRGRMAARQECPLAFQLSSKNQLAMVEVLKCNIDTFTIEGLSSTGRNLSMKRTPVIALVALIFLATATTATAGTITFNVVLNGLQSVPANA